MNFPNTRRHFDAALARGLTYPRVRLQHGVEFKITRRTRKLILVVGGEWLATIAQNGDSQWRGAYPTGELYTELRAFEDDPAARAAVVGLQTGSCCYCGLELTTPESVGNGYGPVCAEKWGLQWLGTTAAKIERARRLTAKLDEARRIEQ